MTLPDYLGVSIRIRTTYSDDVIQGEVFSYDVGATNTLVLKAVCDKGTVDYNVIRISSIKEIIADPQPERKLRPEDPASSDRPLPGCDYGVLENRECRAVDAFVKTQRNIGIGVSREAQEIFDFISKTHPDCQWEKDVISVMGVQVSPPYGAENCCGSTAVRLERLQKVLDGFHNRQQSKKTPASSAATQVSGSSDSADQNNVTCALNDPGSTTGKPSRAEECTTRDGEDKEKDEEPLSQNAVS